MFTALNVVLLLPLLETKPATMLRSRPALATSVPPMPPFAPVTYKPATLSMPVRLKLAEPTCVLVLWVVV